MSYGIGFLVPVMTRWRSTAGTGFYEQFLDTREWPPFMRAGREAMLASRPATRPPVGGPGGNRAVLIFLGTSVTVSGTGLKYRPEDAVGGTSVPGQRACPPSMLTAHLQPCWPGC